MHANLRLIKHLVKFMFERTNGKEENIELHCIQIQIYLINLLN